MVQDADSKVKLLSKAHLKKINLNTSFNGHFFTLSDGILPAQNETCRWNKQLHNRTWLFSMARFCLINWFLTSCSKDCITMINYYGEPGQKLKRTDSRAEPEIARWLKTSQRATHMLNVFEELIDNWEQSTEAAGTGNKNSSKYGVTWYTSIR